MANHRLVPGSVTNDDIGFAVSKASEFAGTVRNPHAIVSIGAKEKRPADDAVNRNVLDDAAVFDPKQVMLVGCDGAGHQRPDVAVAIFGERTGRLSCGDRPAVGARGRGKTAVLAGPRPVARPRP